MGRDGDQTGSTASSPAAPFPASPASSAIAAATYLEQLGPGSRRTMREALDKLARLASDGRCDRHELPWHLLEPAHTAALRTRLCATLAPATANKHMAALRGVLKQCWRQGLLSAEAYQCLTDLPPIRAETRRPGVVVTQADFERILRVCAADEGPSGARDEALLSLLRLAGLRRAEAVALDRSDYDAAGATIVVRAAARDGAGVRAGSGTRDGAGPPEVERRIPTDPEIDRALARWLLRRGDGPGPLFNPVNKGGRIERRRLSEQAIYIACQKRAAEAGLPPTSPEDLRRPVS